MLPPSDPLSEALAETAALLRTLGIADPLDKLRPVFAKVRQRWAGERVHIARADAGERAERERKIKDAIAAGLPAKTIAAQVGVHPSTVRRKNPLKDWAL